MIRSGLRVRVDKSVRISETGSVKNSYQSADHLCFVLKNSQDEHPK